MGPTRVWYLLGAGAGAAEAEPMGRDLLNGGKGGGRSRNGAGAAAAAGVAGVAAATAARAVGATVATGWLRLELPAGGGEDCLTLGLKLCPPRVLTMAGLEKQRRWRGDGKEDRFQK